MSNDDLRQEVTQLLIKGSASRVSPSERESLARLAGLVCDGMGLDEVGKQLPSMRYVKGLVMALGWAAEATDTLGDWRCFAIEEYRRHRDHYLKVVREPGAGDDPN